MKRPIGVLVVVLGLSAGALRAQGLPGDSLTPGKSLFPAYDDIPEVVSFLAPLILPKILGDCALLKEYIRGDDFQKFRREHGDPLAVDAVFDRAVRLSWNNIYEALLISLFATMDHRNFGVRLPFVGALLWIPLTSEFPGEFRERVAALPKEIYPDTPPGAAGDRDKLQHFFGSAFFTYLLESPTAADRLGNFIEVGEEDFIVGGVNDPRDVRSNRQGQQFGLALLRDRTVLPSGFLRFGLHPSVRNGQAPGAPDSLMEVR